MKTAHSLAIAWADKAGKVADTLDHAAKAPALFKPEYVDELILELRAASAWRNYWLAQASAESVPA